LGVGAAWLPPRGSGAAAPQGALRAIDPSACPRSCVHQGSPRLEIKIVDEAQGRYRAYIERVGEVTTIKVLGGHAAIKRHLGPGPEFPHQDSPTARLVIAEIVAGEAARLVMERKYRTTGDLDGPAFYAEHLLYLEKYLPRCHRMMSMDSGDAASQ
jgi:hypothetical protein